MNEPKIRILDPIVADQIAAGEVVERPGSVVKELVENSIDSGATRIQVEIEGGGAGRIRVTDNGCGLSPESLELAFTRHATSKISSLDDLETIDTFGFRGEALPSIASVSKVEIRTRTASTDEGTELIMEGGKIISKRAVGCPVGTDFTVKDLFFNTPARLKFLKRESTEAGHCAESLVRLALVHPEIAFAFLSGGRKTRDLVRVEKPQERVASLFPDETLALCEGEIHGVHVTAILGPPQRARAGAGSLYTYVNGRFVRDKAVLRAVTQAFAGTLEHGRYPVGYISLNLPGGSFDVNVHPQKTEVRFSDQGTVYRAVSAIVTELTSGSPWSRGVPTLPSQNQSHDVAPNTAAETSSSYSTMDNLVAPPPNFPSTQARRRDLSRQVPAASIGGPIEKQPVDQQLRTTEDSAQAPFSRMRYIGQAKRTYLILEDQGELVVIDQHAAHERVTYEELRVQLKAGTVASQRLLAPHVVDLGPAEAERIASHEERLGRLGLEVSRSGADRISIHSVPAKLEGVSPDRLLAEMILAIESGRTESAGDTDDHVVATMACHGSIRAGRDVTPQEVQALLKAMDKIDFAGHCPHGRPVLARFPWNEIERRVGRE